MTEGRYIEYGRGGMQELSGSSNSARLVEDVTQNVSHFNRNVIALEKLVKRWDMNDRSGDLMDSIPQLQRDTAQLAKITNSSIQKVTTRAGELDEDARMRFDRVTSTFTSSLARFQKLQKVTKAVENDAVQRARASSYRSHGSDGGFGEDDDQQGLLSRGPSAAQTMDLEHNTYLVEERERDMRQLETDIVQINDIFRDLGTMVYEQGEIIDSIEANVEQGAHRVTEGNKQLVKAIKHQRSKRKLCCCFWCILITIAIVILIVVLVLLKVVGVIK
ncbi:syntaxin-7-like isoform X2 [Dysidea avara]|uniref:syntaxin-7-like isoform X2 n=1 Tax=Dysidea avara TaxID=196820 RepID=UPI00332C296D